jgi:hypothetical protein
MCTRQVPHGDVTQLTPIAFAAWKGKRGSLLDHGRTCAFYLRGCRYFATTSSPICLPMAVPTSVELR